MLFTISREEKWLNNSRIEFDAIKTTGARLDTFRDVSLITLETSASTGLCVKRGVVVESIRVK